MYLKLCLATANLTQRGKWKRRIRSDADTDTNKNSFFSPVQCRTEAKHGYSFAKVACLAY